MIAVRVLNLKGELVEEGQIDELPFTVGRGSECDLCLDTHGISRTHLEIAEDRDGIYVKDLKSTNGTLLNGIRITVHRLEKTVRLKLGSYFLELIDERPEPDFFSARTAVSKKLFEAAHGKARPDLNDAFDATQDSALSSLSQALGAADESAELLPQKIETPEDLIAKDPFSELKPQPNSEINYGFDLEEAAANGNEPSKIKEPAPNTLAVEKIAPLTSLPLERASPPRGTQKDVPRKLRPAHATEPNPASQAKERNVAIGILPPAPASALVDDNQAEPASVGLAIDTHADTVHPSLAQPAPKRPPPPPHSRITQLTAQRRALPPRHFERWLDWKIGLVLQILPVGIALLLEDPAYEIVYYYLTLFSSSLLIAGIGSYVARIKRGRHDFKPLFWLAFYSLCILVPISGLRKLLSSANPQAVTAPLVLGILHSLLTGALIVLVAQWSVRLKQRGILTSAALVIPLVLFDISSEWRHRDLAEISGQPNLMQLISVNLSRRKLRDPKDFFKTVDDSYRTLEVERMPARERRR